MAVLEIQSNGDSAVSKEAIDHAGQSLEDPLMRVKDLKLHIYNRITNTALLKCFWCDPTLTGIYPVVCTHRIKDETHGS